MSKSILILCTGNTCRSQMAEGILRELDTTLNINSAGTRAELYISPYAVRVMKEIGIDISNQYPKSVNNFLHVSFDYLITVCDEANDHCPNFTGKVVNRINMPFPDPADAKGNDDNKLNVYRNVRDMIEEKMKEWYFSEIEQKIKTA